MACVGMMIGLFLSVTLVSHCVLTAFVSELRFSIPQTKQPKEEVEVEAGSSVTFICVLQTDVKQVIWKKRRHTWALVNNTRNQCWLESRHQRFETKGCANREYTIVMRNVSKNDQAEWYCQTSSVSSQKIFMNVGRSEATTPAENESITDDQSEVHNGKLNMTAVIGGAVGGVIGLVLIITIVAVGRRTRTHSRDERKPTNDIRIEGQHNNFGAFEEDIGGQYAAISDTKNLTPDKVAAENPMYESYGQEDGGGKTGISAYDHVPDVYSVVQKPLKSQSSINDVGKDPNPPVTDDNVADVYSVVQKSSKLQESGSVPGGTKDTQLSGSDEMGDVYSVVQKPAKC